MNRLRPDRPKFTGFRSLMEGKSIDQGGPDQVLAKKCLKVLATYERYLAVLAAAPEVGIDCSQPHPERDDQRLLAALRAGAGGATDQDLRKILVREFPKSKSQGCETARHPRADDSATNV